MIRSCASTRSWRSSAGCTTHRRRSQPELDALSSPVIPRTAAAASSPRSAAHRPAAQRTPLTAHVHRSIRREAKHAITSTSSACRRALHAECSSHNPRAARSARPAPERSLGPHFGREQKMVMVDPESPFCVADNVATLDCRETYKSTGRSARDRCDSHTITLLSQRVHRILHLVPPTETLAIRRP